MNDDIIAIFEDFIKAFETMKTITPEIEKGIYEPMKDIYERIKNILHIHVGQVSQKLSEINKNMSELEKVTKLSQVKALLERQETFLKAE